MRMVLKYRYLVLLALLFAIPAPSFAQIGVSIRIGPPALPVYEQPLCPEDGYLWTPGYWAYGPGGYFWVPGVWVAPPHVGLLWTPGYWGFAGGLYAWHAGYWGPHVGFYGGVHYGFGYDGVGFYGGRWDHDHFAYNTAVLHVNRTVVRNVYEDRTVIRNTTVVNRASFNGEGGVNARPRPEERNAMHEEHFQRTPDQISHQQSAGRDRSQWASENHGNPGHAAMGTVNERRTNQQERIGNGVKSGQLAPRETGHVEHQEARVNHEVAAGRQANGGKLTPQEHHEVNHQQNQMSKEIHQDKHNDRKAPR